MTAGHVDHGKTSLVKCLTGTDTDRLPEEKKRGMSIDLGFAYLPLPTESSDGASRPASTEQPANTGQSDTTEHDRTKHDTTEQTGVADESAGQIAFVDVPGHEKFVRNMIAGVSAVDAALLVIAADDGPMPQTEEHLSILQLLDVPRAIIAVSKTDLVDQQRLSTVREEIATLLKETRFADALVFDVSINDSESIERVKAALLNSLVEREDDTLSSTQKDDGAYFRMSIDRRFSITGAGTVVTGTVTSGEVTVEQEIYALSGQVALRVRGIHAQSKVAMRAVAGQRCALNLVGANIKKANLQRGDWLSSSESLQPVSYFDVSLTPSLPQTMLKHWTPAHFHVGASDIPCRIALLEVQQAAQGESVYARILCDKPAGVVHGDRFVLRDQSARHTIAGGLVIDPLPPRRGRSRPYRLEVLRAMHQATREHALRQLLGVSPTGVSVNLYSLQFNIKPQAVLDLASRIEDTVTTQPEADAWLMQSVHWQSLKTEVQQALHTWHEKNTDVLGADVEQLRHHMKAVVARPVLNDVLRHLCLEKKLTRRGAVYRVAGRESSLSAVTEKLWKQALPVYQRFSPTAPRVFELSEALDITPAETTALLNSCVAHGRLYRVSDNRYFLPDDVLQLAKIAETLEAQGQLTVAGYRDASGIGRNLVVELLEFFDRVQFTRRLGQQRKLLRTAEQAFVD